MFLQILKVTGHSVETGRLTMNEQNYRNQAVS